MVRFLLRQLTDRTQSVFLSGNMTIPQKLTTGVPQGSVLVQLLFTLYTEDMCEMLTELTVFYTKLS